MLCLAKSFLGQQKVVIIDEATSAVDVGVDASIQLSLSRGLSGSTINVMTHRLSTIINFEKIIVLEDGRVRESGKPMDLCDQTGGHFENLSATHS